MKFEDLYIDDARNKRNLDDLISSFDTELFVPFIGAGTSVPMGETDWDDLYIKLCKSFGITKMRKSKNDGIVNYPRTFSRLFNKISDQEKFYPKLFEHLEPTQTSLTGFYLKLVDLFDSYITTNYDSPIEEAYTNQRKANLTKYYFSCHGLDNFTNCIVYLHGHKDIKFCIIKSEDYDYFYPSIRKKPGIPIIENFLNEVFSKRSVIFVGFSFNDKYIEEFLRFLNLAQPFKYTHYWLIDESAYAFRKINSTTENERDNFYDGTMNIKPIVYKSNLHIFAQRLFEKLIETKPIAIRPGEISGVPVR